MSTPVREQLAHLSWRLCEEGRFCDADLINATLDGLTQFAWEGNWERSADERRDGSIPSPSQVPLVERLRTLANWLRKWSAASALQYELEAKSIDEAADRIEELEAIKVEQAARIWDLEDATWASNVDSDPTDPRLIPLPGGRVAVAAQDLRVGDVVDGNEIKKLKSRVVKFSGSDWEFTYAPGTLVLLAKAADR